MKISLKWLNSYLDRSIDAAEAERVLTNIGFPLESIEPLGDDAALDVEITSNRPDCLSHIGIARELSAATGRKLVEPPANLVESGPPVESLTSVENHEPQLCPLYTARVITGVKVGPSPAWLADRLIAVGLRPVNNVVDVTNYVLYETGQPLHAFDLARLGGRRIVVRRAGAGEPFTAIDGTKHALRPDMLVIADAGAPQAIAGVMGGADSEVTQRTTDVLIESARFDPLSVRTASRTLKLSSDSSYRFERGIDPAGVERANRRAAALILELAGGRLAGGAIFAPCLYRHVPRLVRMRPDRCNALLGFDLPAELMVQWLAALGLCPLLEGDAINCTIPPHRLDLKREVDLIEEIARLHGFDHIPVEPKMKIIAQRPQRSVQARQAVARLLTAHGYFETITFSFVAPRYAQPFLGDLQLVNVDEEKKKAEPALRPSVLPSLLACRKANQDVGNRGVRLFEAARTFAQREAYVESRRLALLADADHADHLRAMRGTIEELLAGLGLEGRVAIRTGAARAWAEPVAELVDTADGDRVIGAYGPATPQILKLFDLQTPVALAELDYEALVSAYPPRPSPGALPRFPAVGRDLSLNVAEPTSWQAIETTIAQVRPALLERVEFVTVYRGKPIPAGRKSVTLRMTFRDPARTLKHEEVNAQVDAVISAVTGELGAEVRTI